MITIGDTMIDIIIVIIEAEVEVDITMRDITIEVTIEEGVEIVPQIQETEERVIITEEIVVKSKGLTFIIEILIIVVEVGDQEV